ncbi:NAD(P)/FAD-dependent oxidoreductase [Oceanidesulfovibrio marinus]|uniref:NAD(P)/FAD-dependent oxidoreductase n=1 Tax=Oceanidesulfovibrio marinus TaxID=370038 RepID=UPI001ABF1749|nr:NAD(P)/FAD-dependent oxidoreductase [Oceanidesulfovibrio marinus]
MKRRDLIIIGAGPAGLSAAIEAAQYGLDVVVYDENALPGGQLFKQIHKFFGSKEHRARERGFRIGQQLLEEAGRAGVEVVLGAQVIGLYDGLIVQVVRGDRIERVRANAVVIATGASENMVPFPGWTLPGVIGAGAAQTMANLHGVRPGNDLLMVGCGNVGVVVAYQMLQAGCRVQAMIDASRAIGGYGVHAAKVARTGVPFFLGHTILQAEGDGKVESATIAQVDERWQPVPGTEKTFAVDTICLAVGLTPATQLSRMAGCTMINLPGLGGLVPATAQNGATSVPGLYVAGDAGGIEEASSAMIRGRLAGLAAARRQGFADSQAAESRGQELHESLDRLRGGPFGERIRAAEELMHKALEKEAACQTA